MKRLSFLAIGVVAAAAAVGCTAQGATTSTISADVSDMKITVDHSSAKAGAVTFVVKNTGSVVHELVVLQTAAAQDKIAPDADEVGKMDETGNVGETGDVAAGATKTFAVTLAAGHYVLICNEVGHYTAGMHMTFTVN